MWSFHSKVGPRSLGLAGRPGSLQGTADGATGVLTCPASTCCVPSPKPTWKWLVVVHQRPEERAGLRQKRCEITASALQVLRFRVDFCTRGTTPCGGQDMQVHVTALKALGCSPQEVNTNVRRLLASEYNNPAKVSCQMKEECPVAPCAHGCACVSLVVRVAHGRLVCTACAFDRLGRTR